MSEHPSWRRITEVFDGALQLSAPAREEWLRATCGQDVALYREVEALLADFAAVDDMPLRVAVDMLSDAGPGEFEPELRVGAKLGSYELVRVVGRGGMGEVYEGRRVNDDFEKRVAIKTIAAGRGHPGVVRRFRRERRILARLEHRNIAALFDGGVTESGLPWLAMEFVDGAPMDTYCSSKGLSIAERIALFRQVCGAVQYAHRALVVHRDLKPSNILVTGDGTVKLLDFGIARVLASEDDSSGSPEDLTEAGPAPLTPSFASPEQLRGEPVTTASDVHALGMVLYLILTGRHPYRNASTTMAEVRRRILEQVPPPTGLGADLDAILATALRKDPERRYASVAQLADDLSCVLRGLPVSARPDSLAYRARKFAQRNKVAVAASLLGVISLVAGLAVSVRQAHIAETERDRARAEAEKATRVTAFVQEMLRAADPRQAGPNLTVAAALEAAAARAESTLAAEPDVRAAVQTSIGLSYLGLGRLNEADTLLRRAYATRQSLGDASAMAASLRNLALVASERGAIAPAESLYQAAIAAYRSAPRLDSVALGNALNEWADLLQYKGDLDRAEHVHREALRLRERTAGPRSAEVAASLNNLAVVFGTRGDWAKAESLHRAAVEIIRDASGDRHPDVAAGVSALAFAVQSRGRPAEAESLYRQALALRVATLGERHPETARTRMNLGWLLHDTGRYADAIPYADAVLAVRSVLGEEHPAVASTLVMRGQALTQLRRFAEGERDLREGLRLRRASLPPGHWLLATTESALGECLALQGRRTEARALLERSYARLRELRGDEHELTRAAFRRLGTLDGAVVEAGRR